MDRSIIFDPDGAWTGLLKKDEPTKSVRGRTVQALVEASVPDERLRRRYAAATMAPVAKLAERYTVEDSSKGTFEGETAFCEDVLGQWTGGPMGIDPSHKNSEDGEAGLIEAADGLALSITYDLPHRKVGAPAAAEGELLPRQIFGLPYWLRLRACFLGGVARPPQAPSRDQQQMPANNDRRRYLRHERIEAPLVVAAQAAIRHVFDATPDGVRETALSAVVRTAPGEAGRTTLRFLVPPSVPARFADQHDVFGDDGTLASETYRQRVTTSNDPGKPPKFRRWKGPKGGLTDVDYDRLGGGFGVFAPGDVKPSPVFRPRANGATRDEPYYPDPAADFIVLALTDAEGRALNGRPLIVPVRPESEVRFPNVRPVAIEIRAEPAGPAGRSDARLDQEQLIGLHGRPPREARRGCCGATRRSPRVRRRRDGSTPPSWRGTRTTRALSSTPRGLGKPACRSPMLSSRCRRASRSISRPGACRQSRPCSPASTASRA